MRFISADYIFPGQTEPLVEGVLVCGDDGTILEILQHRDYLPADAQLEKYRGVICPGFINSHAHLELSYLKGRINQGTGLAGFIKDFLKSGQEAREFITEAALQADAEMLSEGIVAVGDISNTDSSIGTKCSSRIYYHTFVEVFDLHPERADEVFNAGMQLWQKFRDNNLVASLVPHATYTASSKLLSHISDFAYTQDSVLCIHNQECAGENDMFSEGKGRFLETLKEISPKFSDWKATGFRSLPSTFVHLPRCNKIQFVHNTYSNSDDIHWAHLYSLFVWWCLCPSANLYIENHLPDIPLFQRESAKLTLGTDSYASNTSLSVLNEMKCIQSHYPQILLKDLIQWATWNGAEFLGINRQFGSFEKGKRPGVNLIAELDLEKFRLIPESAVRALF